MNLDWKTIQYGLRRIAVPSSIIQESLLSAYKEPDSRVSVETVIGAAAALTGEFALRAVLPPKLQSSEKWIVAGDHINGLLFEEPSILTVWKVLGMHIVVSKIGTQADMPDWVDVCKRQSQSLGDNFFPNLKVDPYYYPHEWSPVACPRFRENVQALATEYKLTPYETALALGSGTGEIIALGKDVLPVKIGMQLAADVMKGVSYMLPWDKPEDLTHVMSFDRNSPHPPGKISIRTSLLYRPNFSWGPV